MNEWDAFVEYCEERGYDPHEENFESWKEQEAERWEAHQDDLDYMYFEGN